MKYLTSNPILFTFVFILILISSTDLYSTVENHNSSRSNRTQIVFPGGGSSDSINVTTIKRILNDIDNTKPGASDSNMGFMSGQGSDGKQDAGKGGDDGKQVDAINEQFVRDLLNKYGIKFINKIIVEKDKQGLYNIILLIDPKNESKARTIIKSNSLKNKRP